MKIASWNVAGRLSKLVESGELSRLLYDQEIDILCLQETKITEAFCNSLLNNFLGDYYSIINGERYYSGTITMIKRSIKELSNTVDLFIPKFTDHKLDTNRGIVSYFEQYNLVVVNVYVPNSGSQLVRKDFKIQWMIRFIKYLNNLKITYPNCDLIVVGDLNVAYSKIDLARHESNYNKTPGFTDYESYWFETLLAEVNLSDSFRIKYPNKQEYSFFSDRFGNRNKLNNVGWRLDYALVSDSSLIQDSRILKDYEGSDHCPILLEID